MAGVTISEVFNTVRSLTLPKIAEKISDNASKNIPLIYFLDKSGNKEHENGGLDYRIPVFGDLDTAQAYTGNTPLDSSSTDPVTVAKYDRKQLSVPIDITGTDLMKNSNGSPESIVDLLSFKIEYASLSMIDSMGGTDVGIHSSNGDSDLGITGLRALVTSTPTTGTVGGLNRATYSWWRNKTDAVTTGFNTDGISSMNALWIAAKRGSDLVSVVSMTDSGFANFLRAMTGTINYDNFNAPNTRFGDIGFDHMNYHGAVIFHDANQLDNTAYFLNLAYMKLMVYGERDFTFRDMIAPANQDTLSGKLFWAGNLVCSNMARQGLLTGEIQTWA